MTKLAVCPHCAWPVLLSLGRCAICGLPPEAGPQAEESPGRQSVDPAAFLVERWLIHGFLIAALLIGGQILPTWLVSIQQWLTGVYFVMVSLWCLTSSERPGLLAARTRLIRESWLSGVLALMVFAGLGWVRQTSSGSSAAASRDLVASQSRLPEDPQLVRLRQQGAQTQAYLQQYRQAQLELNQPNLPVATLLELIPSIADRLEKLPTTGVDVQAVEHVLDVARVLRMLLAYIQRGQDPGYYVESFLRGFSGDPFGAAAEFNEQGQNLSKEIQRVDSNERRLKAVLAARYNMTFE